MIRSTFKSSPSENRSVKSIVRQRLRAQLLGLCAWLFLGIALAADVIHYYDPLGRLVETVGPDGSSIQYSYDAVGNITSVRRKAANVLSISGFVPASGDAGTLVTVFGSGFDAVAANNAVTLNGVAVSVSSATPTSLSFVVASNASSGKIQISNANGSATSQTAFTVVANRSPRITSFSPTVALQGTQINITGTNFLAGIGNKVLFGRANAPVLSANTTTISAVNPPGVRSGKISVTTPYGSVVSAGDFYAVPSNSQVSEIATTQRIAVDGPSPTVSLAAGKKALLIFDGALEQYVSIGVTGITDSTVVGIYRPDGTSLALASLSSNNTVLRGDATVTPETYTLQVAAPSAAAASLTLTLSSDLKAVMPTDGSTIGFATGRAGQRGRYSFSAAAGQNMLLSSSANTFAGGVVTVYAPGGTAVGGMNFGNSFQSASLPVTGTYAVFIEPYGTATGSVNLSLRLASDVNGTIAVDGSPAVVTLNPVQRGIYKFAGTAGQKLGLGYTGVSLSAGGYLGYVVLKPDGSQLFSGYTFGDGSNNLPVLPVTGNYTLQLLPNVPLGTAKATVWLSSDLPGTLAPGGAALTFNTARPGQNGQYTFTGAAGQNLIIDTAGNTFSSGYGTIFQPDGSTLGTVTFGSSFSYFGLPATGTYTVFMDPSDAATGSVSVAMQLANDINSSITPDAAPLAVTLNPGQRGNYTFTGTAGQKLGLGYTGVSLSAGGYLGYILFKPDGSQLFSGYTFGDGANNLPPLPVSGTYTLQLRPSVAQGTAKATVWLSNDLAGTLVPGGAASTFNTARPGQNGRYTFTGTAGQNLTITTTGNTFSSGYGTIYQPDGSPLGTVTFGSSFSFSNLPATGTYTVFMDPWDAAIGSVNLLLQLN